MDINALGARYMNQGYVPFSSSASAAPSASGVQAPNPAGEGAFESLLKKAQEAASGASESGRPADAASSQVSGTPSAFGAAKTPIDKNDKLYELCMDLETFLIKNLIKGMRSTVQKTGLINTGFAGEMYEDMLYDEYAKSFAQNANFGFAEMAYRDLTRGD